MGKALTVTLVNVAAVLAVVLVAGLLAGCTTTPAPADNPRQVWCDHNSPRRPTLATIAAMDRAEIDEMNAHNALGQKWCGWRPG